MITGMYGLDESEFPPPGAGTDKVAGSVTQEQYDADPDLVDGLGSMHAFLKQERESGADSE